VLEAGATVSARAGGVGSPEGVEDGRPPPRRRGRDGDLPAPGVEGVDQRGGDPAVLVDGRRLGFGWARPG
jgi:hypothetical protein